MLEQRQLIAALVRELAMQAELIEQHDGAAPLWRLRVERESLRSNALRDKLQAALAEGLGITTLRLELEAGAVQDTPAKRVAAERQRRQQEAETDHPQRPAGAGDAGAVQDGAHRARFDQTALGEPPMMKQQLAGLMKQAQAMQDNLKRAQDELALIEVEGVSGAGLVKVTMTCKHDVKRITIDPSLLADDKDMLEDLVAAAFNDGVRRAEAVSQEKMGKLTAGMPMPPGMKFPF